eukprot:g9365.t1
MMETSFICSGPCPAGTFCPEASPSPIPCGNNTVYCPAGSSTPTVVSPGKYTFGGTSAARRIAEEFCPKGRYCKEGVATFCPAGTFGDREGLQDAWCSGPCPAGWFCPPGTVDPYSFPCGGAGHFCPEGVGKPLPVSRGYFADDIALDLVGGTGGYSSQTRCPIGTYCLGGVSFPCPAGRFGASQMSVNASCSGSCSEGHFCPEGSHRADQYVCGNAAAFCPEGSSAPTAVSEGFYTVQGGESDTDRHPWLGVAETRTTQVQCEPGHYCVGGVRFPCPPGYFGNASGLSTPRCSGLCAAGYVCGAEATTPTEAECGGEGDLFCPEGSSSPTKVSNGYYTHTFGAAVAVAYQAGSDTLDITTRTAESLCEPGFWCKGGFRYPCEAGSFGDAFGATDGNCSGACSGGFVCGSGSVSAEDRPCGDPSVFCPGGNWEPVEVSVGYYSVGGGGPTTRTGQELSPPGSYADQGLQFSCPAGTYGATHGLSSPRCSGICAPGFYCPVGSISPRQWVCGGASFVCPAGSGWPIAVDDGYYTTDYSSVPDAEDCPPGFFRNGSYPYDTDPTRGEPSAIATAVPLAPCQPCPEGTFKATTGDSLALCLPCEENTSESIEARTSCICRRIAGGEVSARVLYFNTTTAVCQNVTASFRPSAEVAVVESTFTRYSQKECEPGHFCVQGVRFPCPAGRFGARARETRPACQGDCAAGWYCPEGSVSANQIPCGAVHLYCPVGSAAPIFVAAGYYTTASALSAFSNTTHASSSGAAAVPAEYMPDDDRGALFRSGVAVCPAGWYCTGDGAGSECPPGTYGSEPGLSDPACSGVCAAGFYCGAGATTPTESVCGGSGLYCPVGSSTPSTVLIGFYGVHAGIEAGLQAARDPLNETHSAQVLCEPGYFCEDGRKEPCPPGTFLGGYGESSRESCTLCKAGFYCPGESTTMATPVVCGSPTVFCPAGSTNPVPVSAGYYSVGGGSDGTTRSSQVQCEVGYYCRDAVRTPCPAGTYGESTGLRDAGCSGMCPAGMSCAEGTVDPTPCEDGSYSIGGAVATPKDLRQSSIIMSEEAKTSDVNMSEVHVDTQAKVSKFDQSKDPIPKVVPPRGSKDARSFRPSTLAEINLMNRYEPLEVQCCGKTWGIGCGNSLEDVLLISGCILALWSFVLGVSGLLLKSAIDTDRNHTALWIYFWLFILGAFLMGGMIATGQVERFRGEAEAAKKQHDEDEAKAMA